MILSCPKCQVTYDIPDSYFAQGQRRVRCSACSFEWEHSAPEINRSNVFSSYRLEGASGNTQASSTSRGSEHGHAPDHDHEHEHDQEQEHSAFLPDVSYHKTAASDGRQGEARAAVPSFPLESKLWPWLSGMFVLTLLLLGAYFASTSIVTTVSAASRVYRMVGIEPMIELKDWHVCIDQLTVRPQLDTERHEVTIALKFENDSMLGRLRPALTWHWLDVQMIDQPSENFLERKTSKVLKFQAVAKENQARHLPLLGRTSPKILGYC